MHDNWTDYTCSTVTGNCQNVRMKTSRSIEGVTISLRLKNGSLQITNHIDHYHTCSARGRKFSLGEKHLSDTQHFECLFCGHYTHSLFFLIDLFCMPSHLPSSHPQVFHASLEFLVDKSKWLIMAVVALRKHLMLSWSWVISRTSVRN